MALVVNLFLLSQSSKLRKAHCSENSIEKRRFQGTANPEKRSLLGVNEHFRGLRINEEIAHCSKKSAAIFRQTRSRTRSILIVCEEFGFRSLTTKEPYYFYYNYLRDSFASIVSVACGTLNRRSRGINLPVVLQIP